MKMNIKIYKVFITLITIIYAITLTSCGGSQATSTRTINTPTAIKVSTSTKTLIPFSPTPTPKILVGTVLSSRLNVRSGPGTNNGVIGSLNGGEQFYVLDNRKNLDNNTWFLIPLPDNSFGWVIGEPSYVTSELVLVDSSTYNLVQSYTQKARNYLILTPISNNTFVPVSTQIPKNNTRQPSKTPKVDGGTNGKCHPAYPGVCIAPRPPDLDCKDIPYRRFTVLSPDPHNFDGDGDGIGCEG